MSIGRQKKIELHAELCGFASSMMQNAQMQFPEFTKNQPTFQKLDTPAASNLDYLNRLGNDLKKLDWPKESKKAFDKLLEDLNDIQKTTNPDLNRMQFYRNAYAVLANLNKVDEKAIKEQLKIYDHVIEVTKNAKIYQDNKNDVVLHNMRENIFIISPVLRNHANNQQAAESLPVNRAQAGGARIIPPPPEQKTAPIYTYAQAPALPLTSGYKSAKDAKPSNYATPQKSDTIYTQAPVKPPTPPQTPPHTGSSKSSESSEYGSVRLAKPAPGEYIDLTTKPLDPKGAPPSTNAMVMSQLSKSSPGASDSSNSNNEYGELQVIPPKPALPSGSLVKLGPDESIEPADKFTPPSPRGPRR